VSGAGVGDITERRVQASRGDDERQLDEGCDGAVKCGRCRHFGAIQQLGLIAMPIANTALCRRRDDARSSYGIILSESRPADRHPEADSPARRSIISACLSTGESTICPSKANTPRSVCDAANTRRAQSSFSSLGR
jgi:hypothetical protein